MTQFTKITKYSYLDNNFLTYPRFLFALIKSSVTTPVVILPVIKLKVHQNAVSGSAVYIKTKF